MIKLIKDKKNFIFDSFEEQNLKKNHNLINKNNISFLLINSKENSNNNSKKKFINLLNITNNNSNENSLRNKFITSKIKIKSRNKINNENLDDDNNNNNNLNFCFTDTNKKIYKDSSMQTNFNINKNKFLEQKKIEYYGLLSKKNKNNFIENSKNKLYSIKTNTNFVPIIDNSNKKILFKNRILNNINYNNNNQNILNNYNLNSIKNKNILLKTNKIKNLSNREINLMKNPESYFYQIYYGLEYYNKMKLEQFENKNLKIKKKEYYENFEKMKEPANHVLNKLKLDFVLEDHQKSKAMVSSKTFLDYNVRMKF